VTDTPPPSLRDRIDTVIRPTMLIGLQDAELHDEPGRERIGEWADWITGAVLAVVQPELDARDAEIDRLRDKADTERKRWAKSQDRAWKSHLDFENAADERDHHRTQLHHAEQALADVQASPDAKAARLAELHAALNSLAALHQSTHRDGREICAECRRPWPCRTSDDISAARTTTS
jgi:hypothetical protein